MKSQYLYFGRKLYYSQAGVEPSSQLAALTALTIANAGGVPANLSYGGGDAGGGNATITYNFSNFNDLVVLHSGDPIRGNNVSAAATGYWADKFA